MKVLYNKPLLKHVFQLFKIPNSLDSIMSAQNPVAIRSFHQEHGHLSALLATNSL